MSPERGRARYLKNALQAKGIVPDDFMEEGYTAIGIHSNSTIFACNQGLADMMGYSINELEGMNAWKLFPPESTELVMKNLKAMSELPYQVMALRNNGSKFLVELKGINFELAGDVARAVLLREV